MFGLSQKEKSKKRYSGYTYKMYSRDNKKAHIPRVSPKTYKRMTGM